MRPLFRTMRRDFLPCQDAPQPDAQQSQPRSKCNPLSRLPVEPSSHIQTQKPRNHHQPAQTHDRDRCADHFVQFFAVFFSSVVQPFRHFRQSVF